jgi:hypothetical protein
MIKSMSKTDESAGIIDPGYRCSNYGPFRIGTISV